jgi:hypothetical protein
MRRFRFRFAHGDPLRALYVLGRSRRFDNMCGGSSAPSAASTWTPSAVTLRTAMVVLGRVAKVCTVRETVDSFRRLERMLCGR